MFSRASKKPSEAAPAEPQEPPERRREAPPPTAPSVVSADLKIVGDLSSSGDIQVDGNVEGDVTGRELTIGRSAVVRGAVIGQKVRIHGTVTGEVRATDVMLSSTAKVDGDIAHQTLAMEAGASLVGHLRRLERDVGAPRRAVPDRPEVEPAVTVKPATTRGEPNGSAPRGS